MYAFGLPCLHLYNNLDLLNLNTRKVEVYDALRYGPI